MLPVDQTSFYKPDEGQTGNCMQAAVASIFGLSLDQVPNFIADESTFWESYTEFVHQRGYRIKRMSADEMKYMDCYYLAFGPSPRGVGHAVIYRKGELAHDPHPSRAGINEVHYCHVFIPVDPEQLKRPLGAGE